MNSRFEITYEVDDGPQEYFFEIDSSVIEEDMDENDILDLYVKEIDKRFRENIYPKGTNEKEFVDWSKRQIAERKNSA